MVPGNNIATWTLGYQHGRPPTVAQIIGVHLTSTVVTLATDIDMALAAAHTMDIHIDFGDQHCLGRQHGPRTPACLQAVARITDNNMASWGSKDPRGSYSLKEIIGLSFLISEVP